MSSAPLDRLDARLLDPPNNRDYGDDEEEDRDAARPTLSLTFTGTDVVSGIRQLAELGIVNAERMPSWMTGEEAVSVAIVRKGRVINDGG